MCAVTGRLFLCFVAVVFIVVLYLDVCARFHRTTLCHTQFLGSILCKCSLCAPKDVQA